MVSVADEWNHRVQKFTPKGEYVISFGTKGSAPGRLIEPCSIAIDHNDLLYVCERLPNKRISVFTTRGEFLHCFGSKLLDCPFKCAFDRFRGHLYVCDNHKNVKLF